MLQHEGRSSGATILILSLTDEAPSTLITVFSSNEVKIYVLQPGLDHLPPHGLSTKSGPSTARFE